MAATQYYDQGYKFGVTPSNGAATTGTPGRWGQLTGVSLNTIMADGTCTMDFGPGVWRLLVDAHVNGGGGSAIVVGDSLFYTDAATNLSNLSKDVAGYFFGYAMQANAGAGTATVIRVLHVPGGGMLSAGAIGSTQLAANAVLTAKIADNNVTAGKLTATLRTGFIPLPLAGWSLIAAADIPNIAAIGGRPAKDSVPIFERVNVGTDPQLRLKWAATTVIPVTFNVISPPDYDPSTLPSLKIYAAMAAANDVCTLTTSIFEGVGGANRGGTSMAVTTATPAVYTQAFTSSTATAAAPLPWAFTITPGAHGTDFLAIYAAWIQYLRL